MEGFSKHVSHGSAVIKSGDREDLFQSDIAERLVQICCSGCRMEFSTHHLWEEHLATGVADDCHGDAFNEMYVSTEEVLEEDDWKVKEGREHGCEDCGRFFGSEEERDEHRGTVSTSVRLVCPQCGVHAGDMEQHLVQHTGDVQCGECNDFFGDINVHIENVHSGYSSILTTLHTRCAGDGITLGWREVSLRTNARFLASEVKPAGDAAMNSGLIVDYIQIPSATEEENKSGEVTEPGSASNKKLQSRLLYNENRQKALMPPDQLPDRFFGVNGERLWTKFPPGAHICELCGFKAVTKNKYREKQDHYAKWHFKERLELLLPQVRPYLCPDAQSGCDYSGKDKQTVMRHYTGKHNIFELWVSEFINDITNPLVCRQDLVRVHKIENVDLDAKRSSSVCTVRFTNGTLRRVPMNSMKGIAPQEAVPKVVPSQTLKRNSVVDDDNRSTRIRCSFCPDLQVFESEQSWKTHCALKHDSSNNNGQQAKVSPKRTKSPITFLTVFDTPTKCPGCHDTFSSDDALKDHWPDCEGTPESIQIVTARDAKPMTSIPIDAFVEVKNGPEPPPKKKLKRPPPALIPINKMNEMVINNDNNLQEDIMVKVEPDDIFKNSQEAHSELMISDVCSMNQVLQIAQVSSSSMLCLTCPNVSEPLTSFADLAGHIHSSHYDLIVKRKFILVNDKFKSAQSQSYLCTVCGQQYEASEGENSIEQHSQQSCDPLALVFEGFTEKSVNKKPYMPSTAQITAVPLEKRRKTDLVVVSKDEVPKEVVENYEKVVESTSQEFKIRKGGPAVRFPCECSNCRDPNYFGKEHCCNVPGCDKTFSKTAHLRAHLRGHNNERPYPCSWPGCGRRFVRSDELRRHAWIHTRADRFKCEACGKGYSRADHFRVHVARCLDGGVTTNPLETMGELIYI